MSGTWREIQISQAMTTSKKQLLQEPAGLSLPRLRHQRPESGLLDAPPAPPGPGTECNRRIRTGFHPII